MALLLSVKHPSNSQFSSTSVGNCDLGFSLWYKFVCKSVPSPSRIPHSSTSPCSPRRRPTRGGPDRDEIHNGLKILFKYNCFTFVTNIKKSHLHLLVVILPLNLFILCWACVSRSQFVLGYLLVNVIDVNICHVTGS